MTLKKKVFAFLQYTLFLTIGLLLLWLVFRKIDLALIVNELESINYFWITLIFLTGILSHISRAIRWNLLIGAMNYKTSHLRTFYAVMIGYLANLAIPRIGEVTRCGILSKTEKIPVNSLIGTVISERIFDMIVLLIITFLVIIFQIDLVGGFVSRYLLDPLTAKFNGSSQALLVLGGGSLLILFFIYLTYRILKPRLLQMSLFLKLKKLFLGFWDGILAIKTMKKKGQFLFWTVIIWLNYFLMTYLCFFAMSATSHLTVIDGLTVLSLGSFGIVAPVPGGIGAYHFIVKAILFELYHIPAPAAASYATIAHFTQTILLLVLGALAYLMVVLYLKKKNNEPA